MELYSSIEPKNVEVKTYLGMKQRTINYDVQKVNDDTEMSGYYRYKSVTLRPGQWDYASIVSALVSAEYPRDRMEAIVNNFMRTLGGQELAEEKRQEYLSEYREMETFRDRAKSLARTLLEATENNT